MCEINSKIYTYYYVPLLRRVLGSMIPKLNIYKIYKEASTDLWMYIFLWQIKNKIKISSGISRGQM